MGTVLVGAGSRIRRLWPGWIRGCSGAALLGLLLTSCSVGSTGPTSAAMTLSVTQGTAAVSGAGSTHRVSGDSTVGVGDQITVPAGGLAVLHLGPGLTFQIEPGVVDITSPNTVQVVSGAALGQLTSHGEIDSPGVTTESNLGVFRVATQPAFVGVYSGTATVSVPAGSINVPAFRQVDIVNGALPASPTGLRLSQNGDPWDQQFLQPALRLDAQLASFGNGLDAQLGSATGAAFFRTVVPDAGDLAYLTPFFPEPRSDVLIGWVIATGASEESGISLPTLFYVSMALWEQGESWGTIAMEFGVSAADVFAGLQDAITSASISLQNPTPILVTVPLATPAPTPRRKPTPQATTQPSVTQNPTQAPAPSVLGSLLAPVNSLLGQILNLLLPSSPPAPTPSPTP